MNGNKNKKICFIHTSLPQKAGAHWPPVGILHMAALLEKQGHMVTIVDREAALVKNNLDREIADRETLSIVKNFGPDYVGISAFTPLISDAYHVAKIIKRHLPDVPVLLGGPHATALGKEVLHASPHIDLVVKGEGEYAMLEIASEKPFTLINGIVFRNNNNITVTQERSPIADLGSLPFPAWDHIDMRLYTRPSAAVIRGYFTRAATIMTSRGCPFRCAYCAGGFAFKNKLNFFPVDYVIRQIEDVVRRFHVDAVYFLDDQFTARPSRVYELCDAMIQTGLHKKVVWGAQVRVDSVNRDILIKMKEAGCIQVEFGFESHSQPILDLMEKCTTVEQNERAAALCNDIGIRMLANLMTNFPEETAADMEKTVEFAGKYHFVHISFQKMVPLPGTGFWHSLKKKGMVKDDWETYHTLDLTHNYTNIPDEQFHTFFLKSREWMDRIDVLSDLKSYLAYKGNRVFSFAYIKNLITYISFLFDAYKITRGFKKLLKTEFVSISAFLIFLLLLFFYKPILQNKMVSPNDLLYIFPPWNREIPEGFTRPGNPILRDCVDQFYPWKNFAKELINEGTLPLWNPYMQSGAPLIANYQSAVFFPLHYIHYFFSDSVSSWLVPLLKLYIAGIFMYYFLRAINIGMFGAIIASIAFMFNANLISFILKPLGSVYIFLPALFLFTHNIFDRSKRNISLFFLSLTAGIQFTGGHPETSFNIVIFSTIYFFLKMFAQYRENRNAKESTRLTALFISAHVLGFFIAAIQVFPFFEYLYQSSAFAFRSIPHEPVALFQQIRHSVRIARLMFVSLNVPYFFGSPMEGVDWESIGGPLSYIGIIPFMFLLVTIFLKHKDKTVKTFYTIIIICFIFVLDFPILNKIISILPGFNIAITILVVTIISFLFCVLTGIGAQFIISKFEAGEYNHFIFSRIKIILLINFLIFLGYAAANLGAIYSNSFVKEELIHCSLFLFFYISGFTLLSLFSKKKISGKSFAIFVIILTFIDLFIYSVNYNPSIEKKSIYPETEHIKFLKRDNTIFRIAADNDILIPEVGMIYGLSDIRAYDAIIQKRYSDFMYKVDPTTKDWLERRDFHIMLNSNYTSPLYDLLNVKYLLTENKMKTDKYDMVFEKDNIYIYENRNVLPRAFIVHDIIVKKDGEKILDTLVDNSFDARQTVILEKEIDNIKPPPDGKFSHAQIIDYRPNSVLIETELAGPGVLILADNHYPGWKAYVDGKEEEILRADYTFRAVALREGKHKVTFVYDPFSFILGKYVTILSIGILFMCFLSAQAMKGRCRQNS